MPIQWTMDDLRPCAPVQPVVSESVYQPRREEIVGQIPEEDCSDYDPSDPTPQRDDILKAMYRLKFTDNDLYNRRVAEKKYVYVALFGKQVGSDPNNPNCGGNAKVVSIQSLMNALLGASGYYETARKVGGQLVTAERYFCGSGTIEERLGDLLNTPVTPEHIVGIALRKI